jgi:hypothetical protein
MLSRAHASDVSTGREAEEDSLGEPSAPAR